MVTPIVRSPFDIRTHRYFFKPSHRSIPVVGPWIADVNAVPALQNLVSGKGLCDRDGDRHYECATREDTMWLVPESQAAEGVIFDFGKTEDLESLQIWNYNEAGYTGRGVAEADVSVWTAEQGWKTVIQKARLGEAEGSEDYDEPTLLTFAPIKAQKVRLNNLKPIAEEGFVGLSAIRFYSKVTLSACNPQPQPDTRLSPTYQVLLSWSPGKDAVASDIYAAPEGEPCLLLGRIAQSEVCLTGLTGGKKYRWRADQVQKDGSVTVGPEWSFTVDKGRCVAHWTFDEGLGRIAHNTSPEGIALDATAMLGTIQHPDPNSLWNANGRFGGCITMAGGGAGNGSWFDTGKFARDLGIDGNKTKSVSVWVYPRMMNHGAIWDVGSRDTGANWCLRTSGTDNEWRVQYWGSADIDINTMSSYKIPSKNAWVHMVLTHDGVRTRLYANGTKIVDEPRILNTGDQISFRIGNYGPDGEKFDGMIDDMRLYDCPLSDNQVAMLAEGRDPNSIMNVSSRLALTGADLLDPKADLRTVAAVQTADAPHNNWLAVLAIVAVVVIAVLVMRNRKNNA